MDTTPTPTPAPTTRTRYAIRFEPSGWYYVDRHTVDALRAHHEWPWIGALDDALLFDSATAAAHVLIPQCAIVEVIEETTPERDGVPPRTTRRAGRVV